APIWRDDPCTAALGCPTARKSGHGIRMNVWRYFTLCPPGGSSYGAPVPVEPRNNLRPSAKVISLPFALLEPSLDWYPSTTIFVPSGREFFVKPRRNKTFGVPASKAQFSTVPSGFFTST